MLSTILKPDIPFTVTSKDFQELEHIPREKLVYLSPDSPHVLSQFNHDDVYIVGGKFWFERVYLVYCEIDFKEISSVENKMNKYTG